MKPPWFGRTLSGATGTRTGAAAAANTATVNIIPSIPLLLNIIPLLQYDPLLLLLLSSPGNRHDTWTRYLGHTLTEESVRMPLSSRWPLSSQ